MSPHRERGATLPSAPPPATPPPADLRLHGPRIVEVKARFPMDRGARQRVDLDFFLPEQLRIDANSVPRDRVLAALLTHTRYQVRREGMALLDSDDPDNPLVRIAARDGNLDYEVRMFCNLFHSAIKDELRSAEPTSNPIATSRRVLERFKAVTDPRRGDDSTDAIFRGWYYLLSSTARRLSYRLHDARHGDDGTIDEAGIAAIAAWLDELIATGREMGVDPLQADADAVSRDSALKKWVQSLLYLDVRESKSRDRWFQVIAGVAAGIAMAIAVLATVFAEQRWAGGSLPWAIAAVGAYIVKDRIKEILRSGLVHLVPRLVQDRIDVVRDPEVGIVARKDVVIRYPLEAESIESESWRPISIQKRYRFRVSRILASHRRVDAVIEIMRLDVGEWLSRMDRSWKLWPIQTEGGEIELRHVPRRYTVFVRVGGDEPRWYELQATRERVVSTTEIGASPFDKTTLHR
jgi:hypothetical protein